jgi:hypothetical protein
LGSKVALILLAVAGGALGAVIIPMSQALIARAIYGGLGALATVFLIVVIGYIVHLQITPYRQRNEAWEETDKLQAGISKFLDSYKYAISLDDLQIIPVPPAGLYLAMMLSSMIDRPLEFHIDMPKTYIEIEGKVITPPAEPGWGGMEGILYRSKPQLYVFQNYIPFKDVVQGKLHCELEYGPPGEPLFRHKRDLEMNIQRFSPNDIKPIITRDKHDDIPIEKST